MPEDSNGSGYSIRVRDVWEAQQRLAEAVADLNSTMGRMDERMNEILKNNVKNDVRIDKLENRFNNILMGIGGGIFTALIVYFRGVVG